MLQIFCVDSNDIESFYAPVHPAEKIKNHLQYEQYILTEVVPFIKNKNANPYLVAAGCSVGGYHAVNIAFKHPEYFHKVVGMSARYDLTISMPPLEIYSKAILMRTFISICPVCLFLILTMKAS